MTNQEAIRILEFMKSEMLLSFDHDRKKALELAISALEKQIPKKPAERRDKYTGNDVMSCPNCGAYIGYRDGRTHIVSMYVSSSRCPECGQAIDFGE